MSSEKDKKRPTLQVSTDTYNAYYILNNTWFTNAYCAHKVVT